MSKLTLEEAISHCLEVAEQEEQLSKTGKWFEGEDWNVKAREHHAKCAVDLRQLAEWLTELDILRHRVLGDDPLIDETISMLDSELKEAKRLLKSAIDEWHIVCECGNCGEYCGWFKDGKCTQKWSGEAEALKLIES